MAQNRPIYSRRNALKCLAFGGAGTLFVMSGGVFTPVDLAMAAEHPGSPAMAGTPLFVQISDTHIGFSKDANPDVNGTLAEAIKRINAFAQQPSLIIHTGDITHLSKPAEFDLAAQMLSQLKVGELHTVPGEHDVTDGPGTEYFARFGKASNGRGYYSFDHAGVHFIALVNVLQFKAGGLGTLGAEQLSWVEADLKGRTASTPIVVFAHMPLWTIYEPWGWGTGDAEQLFTLLRRFGSVTVLNGHIHQIVQKVEGNITFHTARSTAYPQPVAGEGPGPGPLKVAAEQLPSMLGLTSVSVIAHVHSLELSDLTLAAAPGMAPDQVKVLIKDFMYVPMALTIKAGTTVTWVNMDVEPHTVVSSDGVFRSGGLDTNENYSYRFDRPGSYPIHCSIHPGMVATIVVV